LDIRSTILYIGDHRVRERRYRLGSVPAELKRAVGCCSSADSVFIGKRFENTKEIKQ